MSGSATSKRCKRSHQIILFDVRTRNNVHGARRYVKHEHGRVFRGCSGFCAEVLDTCSTAVEIERRAVCPTDMICWQPATALQS